MKKVAKHFKRYIKETILAPLFKLCEASLELIVPLVIASIIDKGIGSSDTGYIISMCLVLVMLGAAGLALSLTAQYFAAKSAVGVTTSLKRTLFAHIQTFSYKDIDRLGTSTIITRMTTDATRVQSGINLTLRLLLRSPFVVFGAMIMAFSIDVEAGIRFAIVIPMLAIVVFGVMFLTTPIYKKSQSFLDKLMLRTRENLSGVRIVRAFAKEDDEISEFDKENNLFTTWQKKAGHISALLNPLTYVIINIGILVLIYTGAIKVDTGILTQGEVVALYNYMSQILVELIKLANLIVTISKATASLERINSVIDTETTQAFGKLTKGNKESEYIIEINNVSLRYNESADNALSEINLKVKKGETIGIIGATGSGKTSLVNLIPRLYDATEGEVLLYGNNINQYSKEFITERIAIIPQKAVLFSGSIRENMTWRNSAATDEEIIRAIEIAQGLDVLEHKGGLDAKIEAEGINLSGGQKQRLTIARAIVGSPDVLIMDDSASALDFATDANLRKSIKTLCGDTTVFIVSQRASSVMFANKIVVLDDGKISNIGTHNDLLFTSEIYREIYNTQFEEATE